MSGVVALPIGRRGNPRGPGSRRRRAFTLVELTATLVLAALLAAAVAVSLKGLRRGAAVDDVASAWRAYDEAARAQARASGKPIRLSVDLDANRVRRLDDETAAPLGWALEWPGGPEGVRVDRLLTPSDDPAAGARGGMFELPISARGYGPAYAVRLAGPGGRTRWLMFAGLTGQPRTPADEREVVEAFRLTNPNAISKAGGAPGE